MRRVHAGIGEQGAVGAGAVVGALRIAGERAGPSEHDLRARLFAPAAPASSRPSASSSARSKAGSAPAAALSFSNVVSASMRDGARSKAAAARCSAAPTVAQPVGEHARRAQPKLHLAPSSVAAASASAT